MFMQKFNSWFIEINFFIEGSSNRPYLCRNFLLLFCHMFMMLFSPNFHASCFFLRGEQLILIIVCSCIICHNLNVLFRRERLTIFCVQQHLLYLLELSDQEKETCNVCVVQQYYSSQIGLCLQVKGTLVSFYVHQHWFLKFLLFSQEKGTCIVFCVHQHDCKIFELCSPVRETVIVFDVQQNNWPKHVLSYCKRETLDIVLLLQSLFSNFVWRNIQHAFWFAQVFECWELLQFACNYCHSSYILA